MRMIRIAYFMVGFSCSAYLLYILWKTRSVHKKKPSRSENSKVEYPFFPFHRLSESQQGKSYAIADLLRGNLPQPQQEQEPIAKNNTITSIPKPIQLPTDWDSITAKQLCELPTNQESKAFPTWEEPKLNTPKQYQEPVYNDWSQIPFPRTKNNSQ